MTAELCYRDALNTWGIFQNYAWWAPAKHPAAAPTATEKSCMIAT
jgi:hypothetical protein